MRRHAVATEAAEASRNPPPPETAPARRPGTASGRQQGQCGHQGAPHCAPPPEHLLAAAAPLVAEQAIVSIAKQAVKIAKLLLSPHKTIITLVPLLRHLGEVFRTIQSALDTRGFPKGPVISRPLAR